MPTVLTCWKATRSARRGLGVEVRRSPQAVACRKRDAGELGKQEVIKALPIVGSGLTQIAWRYCHDERWSLPVSLDPLGAC